MYPFSAPAFSVTQPFGQFVVTTLPAKLLLDVAYSDRLKAIRQPDGTYILEGSQRELLDRRLREIGEYIDTSEVAFPNAIILAANYKEEDGLIEEEEDNRWRFETDGNLVGQLFIPKNIKLAPIIDGQHRLFGFHHSKRIERLDTPLLCAIYFDLPKPYQASLFATINANQRPVSKSQTYELFGYNLEKEAPAKWVPEKLSVFLTRKLNAAADSPLKDHIVVAAENDFSLSLSQARKAGVWAMSTATSVEGIVRLISRNPKRDAYRMSGSLRYEGKNRAVLPLESDSKKTPLRELYINENDELIYKAIKNYFTAVEGTLWTSTNIGSYITKTVGIQALFDISVPIMKHATDAKDLSAGYFEEILAPTSGFEFSNDFFQASGTGRGRVRNCLELLLGMRQLAAIPKDRETYQRLLGDRIR